MNAGGGAREGIDRLCLCESKESSQIAGEAAETGIPLDREIIGGANLDLDQGNFLLFVSAGFGGLCLHSLGINGIAPKNNPDVASVLALNGPE